MTKMAAITDAMTQLGDQASNEAIREYVRKTHKIELTPGLVSNYKSVIRKQVPNRTPVPHVEELHTFTLAEIETFLSMSDEKRRGLLNVLARLKRSP